MKRRNLVSHLNRHGCYLIREGARHSWFMNHKLKKYSAVPRHNEIVEFTARKICRDLGIPLPGSAT